MTDAKSGARRNRRDGDSLAACTIISKNYLAHARVLAHSFREYHPNLPFYVLLVDRIDGYFDPTEEPFTIIPLEQLPIRLGLTQLVVGNTTDGRDRNESRVG